MEPIFSREAQVVGWLKEDVIYDEQGDPHAYLRGTVVFTLDGEYLGRLEHGYFRDELGHAVAFMSNAEGSPATPAPRVVPERPMLRLVTAYAMPNVVPIPHPATVFWSELDWSSYLRLGYSRRMN